MVDATAFPPTGLDINGSTQAERALGGSRLLFGLLLCYLFAQCITIPLVPAGPWAMWPTLSDLTVLGLGGAWLLQRRHLQPMTQVQRRVFLLLGVMAIASMISYNFYVGSVRDGDLIGIKLGQYQVYRMLQVVVVFGITAKLPIDAKRQKWLSWVVDAALIVGCLTVLLTFFQVIPLGSITAHLPPGKGSGPWSAYANIGKYGGAGWGTLGYNHAYVATQLSMLLGLRMHLAPASQDWRNTGFLLFTILACFFSEARTGLGLILFYALIFFLKKPLCLAWLMAAFLTLIVVSPFLPGLDLSGLESTDGSLIERQATLLDAGNTENLSGRDERWAAKIHFLNDRPVRWIVGGGFGSGWDTTDSGESAHLLPLHILSEAGVIGLGLAILLFGQILIALRQQEAMPQAMFWMSITHLLSGLAQETFYPVPALIGFLHFYFCSVAIALRPTPHRAFPQPRKLRGGA